MTVSEESAKQLEAAISIAVVAHRGQRDKDGNVYLLHLFRTMLTLSNPVECQAAVLHDVLEDTHLTRQDLENAGVSLEAIESVELLTHSLGKSYAQYIHDLKSDPTAKAVKIADLQDNYRLDRVAYREDCRDEDASRIERYILSYHYLTDRIDEKSYRKRMKALEQE